MWLNELILTWDIFLYFFWGFALNSHENVIGEAFLQHRPTSMMMMITWWRRKWWWWSEVNKASLQSIFQHFPWRWFVAKQHRGIEFLRRFNWWWRAASQATHPNSGSLWPNVSMQMLHSRALDSRENEESDNTLSVDDFHPGYTRVALFLQRCGCGCRLGWCRALIQMNAIKLN